MKEEDPAYFGLPPESELIDYKGADSDVWRVGNFAVKIYHYISEETIEKYQQVTANCISALENRQIDFSTLIPPMINFPEIRVNPIKSVSKLRIVTYGIGSWYILTESDFIEGPQLIQFTLPPAQFQKCIMNIDAIEQTRLINFHSEWSKELDFFKNWEKRLANLSALFNNQTQNEGIRIIPYNIKVRAPYIELKPQLIITDLCSQLGKLKQVKFKA
jgi:hypothetical protein